MQVGWMRLLDYMTNIAVGGAMMSGAIEKAWVFGWRESSIVKAEGGTEMMVDRVQKVVVDRMQKATAVITMIVMHPLAQGHMIGEQSPALWQGHQEYFSVNVRWL